MNVVWDERRRCGERRLTGVLVGTPKARRRLAQMARLLDKWGRVPGTGEGVATLWLPSCTPHGMLWYRLATLEG